MLKNFKINEDWFLLPKFLFFFVYAALASHSPFIALFFQWKGLSKSLIGILLCLYILIGYTATQVWSIMADRFDKHKIFFAFIVFMSGLLNIILYFANSTVPLFIFALALACVELPIFSFLDTHVLSILETANSKQTGSIIKDYKIYFGRNRLWAAISWGIIAFISGLFIEYYGYFSMVILTNSFYFISFFGIYLLPKRLYKKDKNSVEIDVDDTPPNEVVKESSNENLLNKEPSNTINELSFWRKILLIFTPQTICIMIPVLLVGVGLAIVLNFLNLFLQDLQASKTLIGIAVAVSTVMELPFFFYSEKMVEKLHVEGMIILSLIAFIIRFFAYTILTNPWWVLPIELLHGIAYSGKKFQLNKILKLVQ